MIRRQRGRRHRAVGRRGRAALVLTVFVAAALVAGGIVMVLRVGHHAAPPPPTAARPSRPIERAALRLPHPAPPAISVEPAWRRFAVPAAPVGDRPLVAVVIDDLGLDRRRTAAVLRLPGPLTLSFMTYASELGEQTAAGRRAGDELLLHVPMQPIDRREDPGPHALLVGMPADEILAQLRWGLDRFAGFVGVNNHMGSRFTADAGGMRVVMAELRRRGLLFLDSRTNAASAGIREAVAAGVSHAARDVFLDDDLTPAAINRQLARVETVARKSGSAIAIGHAHDPTIAALSVWLSRLPEKGLALVPLSAVVFFRMRETAQRGR